MDTIHMDRDELDAGLLSSEWEGYGRVGVRVFYEVGLSELTEYPSGRTTVSNRKMNREFFVALPGEKDDYQSALNKSLGLIKESILKPNADTYFLNITFEIEAE